VLSAPCRFLGKSAYWIYPSPKQLRHRIKEVWREDTSTYGSSRIDNTIPDTDATSDGIQLKDESQSTEETTIAAAPASKTQEEYQYAGYHTLNLGSIGVPEVDAIHDLAGSTSALKITTEQSIVQPSEGSFEVRGRFTSEDLASVDETKENPPTALFQALKRRLEYSNQLDERDSKRHDNSGNFGKVPVYKVVTGTPLPISDESKFKDQVQDSQCQFRNTTAPGVYSPGRTRADSSGDFPEEIQIEEIVLDPQRVQKLLESIDIVWDLDTVSQVLHRDLVFQNLNHRVGENIPKDAHLGYNYKKMKAYAEMLILSSSAEDAFPLLLLVWIAQRHSADCTGTRALIQCARSAVQKQDTYLIGFLLRKMMRMLDMMEPHLVTTRSLLRLELSRICRQHGYGQSCKILHYEAISMCPSQDSFLKSFSDMQLQISDSPLLDVRSREIISQAFERAESTKYDGAFFREEALENNEFTLRDVLFAETHLVPYPSSLLVHLSIRHLRGCLKHAFSLLQTTATESSCNRQVRVEDMERVVLFDLLENWSMGSCYRVWDDLSFETENPLIGISTLNILSAISALIYQQGGTEDEHKTRLDVCIKHQSSALLNLPDDILVMELLWRSLQRSRILSHEQISLNAPETPFKSQMTRIFKECSMQEKLQEMTYVDSCPTMAETLYTSSTLSSMRTHAAMVHLSSEADQIDVIKTETDHADVIPNWRKMYKDIWPGEDYLSLLGYNPESEDSDAETKEREKNSTGYESDESSLNKVITSVCTDVNGAAESLDWSSGRWSARDCQPRDGG